MTRVRFEQSHLAAFRKASYDLNPLHGDASYALRSQFGKPVVYGMAGVLLALQHWSAGRPFRLHSLHALFRKALFAGDDYDLALSDDAGKVRLALRRGPVEYLTLSFVADHWQPTGPVAAPMDLAFEPRREAAIDPVTAARESRYRMNPDAWNDLHGAFGIDERTLPAGQLVTLLWASYCVGMEMPGRQALFSELKIEFTAETHESHALSLTLAQAALDERFNRYSLAGQGPGIRSLRLAAFRRPDPVEFPLRDLPRFDRGESPLGGKNVFVSGSTRGFGAAFARMSALAGARLALNYRDDASAATRLRDELREAGATAEIFRADMGDGDQVQAMAAAIASSFGPLDLVLDNAAPPIPNLLFAEQSPAQILAFIQRNVAITANTAHHLAPVMARSAQLVHVSSKYLLQPAAGFSHYLAAKSAQAALLRGIALERPDLRVVVARLPRILTDQTNLAFDMDPPRHPGEVARSLILELAKPPGDGNYREIDLSRS